MTHRFDEAVQMAVLGHMNVDHADDNLLIVRAFGQEADVVDAGMLSFDGAGGQWRAVGSDGAEFIVDVSWPGGAITERAEVRREIVALYDESCRRLGVEPRPHA
jgi:Protein of unknown function (DUF2470)